MMMWYIACKDIRNFYRSQRHVFVWLIVSMVVTAVVVNYAYSFARYRGDLYAENTGATVPVYQISVEQMTEENLTLMLEELAKQGLPMVERLNCMTNTQDGERIAGSTFISDEYASLTGAWIEGYASEITAEDENACAVNVELLSYDGRLKMTGETFSVDGQDYIIRGVYQSMGQATDVVVFLDKFFENYKYFDEVWITFDRMLKQEEQQILTDTIKQYATHGSVRCPDTAGSVSEGITASNQLQYSIFIVLLVVFLSSILQYWYDMNVSAYTVYWLTGAKRRTILGIVFGETLILCSVSYVSGLLLNIVIGRSLTHNSALMPRDILLGFGIFFGTMLLLSLVNMVRICRTFSVKNV